MILLDTNVISEPLQPAPQAHVIEWIDSQPIETLCLSAVTVAELRSGVALLPAGKRRNVLKDNLEKQVLPLFLGRVLPFDIHCTAAYAELLAKAKATAKAIATVDAVIAAIAMTNRLTVATRDASPFKAMGLPVINPWEL